MSQQQEKAKPLDFSMGMVIAWKIGKVALEEELISAEKGGDFIDRGLRLVRLLSEAGFEVREKE